MWMTLFILVLIEGLVSSEDENGKNYRRCEYLLKDDKSRNSTEAIPDAEEILLRCPGIKAFINCQVENDLYEEEELGDVESTKSLVDDMCDETSRLHKAYVNSLECYRSMLVERPECEVAGDEVYSEYRSLKPTTERPVTDKLYEDTWDPADYRWYFEKHCLKASYSLACLGIKILETCGSEAQDTFVEIAQKTSYTRDICRQDIVNEVLEEFTVFLSIENKHKEVETIRTLFNINVD